MFTVIICTAHCHYLCIHTTLFEWVICMFLVMPVVHRAARDPLWSGTGSEYHSFPLAGDSHPGCASSEIWSVFWYV